MKNLTEIKFKLQQALPLLRKKFPIASLAVFGSYVRDEQSKSSDVDIMVEFNGDVGWEFLELKEELESLLKVKVDLISRRGIKPRYWEFLKEKMVYV